MAKILILNWRDIKHPRAGGAEVRLHEIYERLVKSGHQVKLIVSQFAGAAANENINGIEVLRTGSDLSYAFICMKNIAKWESDFKADIVVEDLNKLPLYTPWFSKKPSLIQMHHLWLKSIFKEASFAAAFIVWLSEKTVGWFYKSKAFCVVSNSTKIELESLGISSEKISVIHNGTDLDFYKPKEIIPPDKTEDSAFQSDEPKFILWLSRMQKYKGPLDALKAFAQIKDQKVILKMAGDGPYLENVKSEIKKLGLEKRVELLGFVKRETKKKLLQDAALLLQTSYKEGWGLTVTEAGACACPVLAANSPGLRDSVKENLNGILYRPGDILDLSQKIDYLLANDQKLNALKLGGIEWTKQFTWDQGAKETEGLLLKIIQESKASTLAKGL